MRTAHLFGLLASLATLPAQTMTDFTPAQDATIYVEGTANGSGASMRVGSNSQGSLRRSLVRFDLGTLQPGSTVVGVFLSVVVDANATANPHPLSIHPLLAPWTEGPTVGAGQGGPAVAGDVTWTDRSFGAGAWATPGGDFGPASDTLSLTVAGTFGFALGASAVADVQRWIDAPSTNFGWILIGEESPTVSRTTKGLASRESSTPLRLTVTAFEPASATPIGSGCAGFRLVPNGRPWLGNSSFALDLANTSILLGTPTALFAARLAPAPITLLGCPILVDPGTVFATAPVSFPIGSAGTVPLPIPSNALVGLTVFVQVAGIEVSTISTTNAVEVVLGN